MKIVMDLSVDLLPFIAATGLALVHIFAGAMRFLDGIPRNRWLSIAGGVSLAYVFLHLLPELGERQEWLEATVGSVLGVTKRHTYLVALIGLGTFYGLERMAHQSRGARKSAVDVDRTTPEVFWIHTASFAIYNALIGYLLLRQDGSSLSARGAFFTAMALHFIVNDYGLREHHKERYHRSGRWILAAAVLIGAALGLAVEFSEGVIAIVVAFLSGGIILNVLKEELPDERQSRFGALALGMLGYASLLLAAG